MSKVPDTRHEFVGFLGMPGSSRRIEAQEAQGQQDLINSTQLPVRGTEGKEEDFASMGIILGPIVEGELFRDAQLPEGWSKRATDHSMHSDLVDDKGRVRAGIFYKAAFYDRKAQLNLRPRFRSGKDYDLQSEEIDRYCVWDQDEVIWSKEVKITPYHIDQDKWRKEVHMNGDLGAEAWLLSKYPDYQNPLAYWDEA